MLIDEFVFLIVVVIGDGVLTALGRRAGTAAGPFLPPLSLFH
jgi:hypothetical protein